MSLVLGKVFNNEVYLSCDTRLWSNNDGKKIIIEEACITKIIPFSTTFCFCFAGNNVDKAISHIEKIKHFYNNYCLDERLPIDYQELPINHLNKYIIKELKNDEDNHYAFCIINNQTHHIATIKKWKYEEKWNEWFWLWDQQAFESYQEQFLLNQQDDLVFKHNKAFEFVCQSHSVESVGDFILNFKSKKDLWIDQNNTKRRGFDFLVSNSNYLWANKTILNGGSIPIWQIEKGDYSLSYFKSQDPYELARVVDFCKANFCILFYPKVSLYGKLIHWDNTLSRFRKIKEEYNLSFWWLTVSEVGSVKLI